MSSTKLGPVFPTWRQAWDKDEHLRGMLFRIDRLRELRSQGNFVLPSIPKEVDRAALKQCFDTVSTFVALPVESMIEQAGSQLARVTRAISPILPAIKWGRWLYLEKAVEQAMSTGDLLFSAVVLRSLGEEVLRLRALQIGWKNTQSNSPQEIRAWAAAVLIAIEPLVRDHSEAQSKRAEYFTLSLPHAEDDAIRKCMYALNDYIHPNYGSHILSLYPESAAGSRIVLIAVETILGAFLKLTWANDPQQSSGVPIGFPYIADFRKIVRRLKSRTMKNVRLHAKTRYSIPEFAPDSFVDWLSSDDSIYLEAVNSSEFGEVLTPLRNAVAGIPTEDRWRVSNSKLMFELSIARRGEQLLRDAFPDGAPSDQTSGEWFLFAAQSFELLVMTTALKLELFRIQMVRQIVDQNLIGVAACMRTILEHFAISEWLLERLSGQWEELQKKTESTGSVPISATGKIDSELARFLSGTMGTAERAAPWAELKPGINVTSAVASAFKNADHLQSEYDFSSAALHGRLMRSLELCFPNKEFVDNIIFRGVRCLEWVCSRDLKGDHLRHSLQIWSYLKNVVRVMKEYDQLQRHTLVQAVGAVTKLKPVRDYSGNGSSASDPIIFRGPLHYYLAFRQYCEQEHLDRATRRPEIRSGVLYDVLQQGDQLVWFKVGAVEQRS